MSRVRLLLWRLSVGSTLMRAHRRSHPRLSRLAGAIKTIYRWRGIYLDCAPDLCLDVFVDCDSAFEHDVEFVTQVAFIKHFASLVKQLYTHQSADVSQPPIFFELKQELVLLHTS